MSKTKKATKEVRKQVVSEKQKAALLERGRDWEEISDQCLDRIYPVKWRLDLALELIRGILLDGIRLSADDQAA
jgi:hypothetical protein